MATRERLVEALKNADAAGDADAAKKLAQAIRDMDAAEPAADEPQGKQFSRLESAAVGAADVIPGVRDLTARLNVDKFGGDYEAAKRAVDASFGRAAEQNPLSNLGGGVAAGVATLPVLATERLGLAGAAAAQAGAAGAGRGVTPAERAANAVTDAAVAGGVALVSPALVQGARKVVSGAQKFLPTALSKGAGVRTLARDRKEVEALKEAAKRFRDDTGRGATLAEIATPKLREQISTASGSTLELADKASRTLRDFQEKFQARGAKIVRNGKPQPMDIPATEAALRKETTAAMGAIEDTAVNFADADRAFLNSRTVQSKLRAAADALDDPARSQALLDLAQSVGEKGANTPVRLRDVENLRLALKKLAGDDPGIAYEIGKISDKITAAVRNQVPEYGQILDNFAAVSKRIEASKLGDKAASTDPLKLAREASVEVGRRDIPEFQAAARESLTRQFESGSNAALRAAQDLSGTVEGAKRAQLALGADAPRVTGALKAEADGLVNIARAVSKTSSEKVPDQSAANAALSAAGFAGGARGFWLTASAMFRKVGMSRQEAKEIVDLALREGGAEDAIKLLEKNRLARDKATKLVSLIPAATALSAAGNSEEQ